MKKIILASKSPRRKELLNLLDVEFSIEVRAVNEVFSDRLKTDEVAEYLARLKADAFKSIKPDELIITADTVVVLNDEILGKPKNTSEAQQMLKKLSDKSHLVITGVCLKTNDRLISFSSSTKVYFKKLTTSEIDYYIENYQPFDKAGSYGIQEWIGAIGITKIEGSYYNVVGLPIYKLNEELKQFI
ncbi:Maf family nucleotide pyrophosphatase [bacterium]|nr:Maf family nucleotide pyrophosphatase [bacterium]|tara:strand:+ start:167 stop:727 length:561 start_codon:yes stop_codon:yes gene_type:complete